MAVIKYRNDDEDGNERFQHKKALACFDHNCFSNDGTQLRQIIESCLQFSQDFLIIFNFFSVGAKSRILFFYEYFTILTLITEVSIYLFYFIYINKMLYLNRFVSKRPFLEFPLDHCRESYEFVHRGLSATCKTHVCWLIYIVNTGRMDSGLTYFKDLWESIID